MVTINNNLNTLLNRLDQLHERYDKIKIECNSIGISKGKLFTLKKQKKLLKDNILSVLQLLNDTLNNGNIVVVTYRLNNSKSINQRTFTNITKSDVLKFLNRWSKSIKIFKIIEISTSTILTINNYEHTKE